ncbi:MAG TPA: sigma 54-interacting transcriptional regulator [Phycisphaerae bacterium]|nr:sigma 54-interacting transcriptional regulator [Phycisphaerae bacterium]
MTPDQTRDGQESYYRRLLQVAEAANAHLDMTQMLESLTAVLAAVVPLDGVGVIANGADGMVTPLALHLVDTPRHPGETLAQTIERVFDVPMTGGESMPPPRPIRGTTTEHVRNTRSPLLCTDTSAPTTFTDLPQLIEVGVQSFVCAPLFVQDWFLGAICFVRRSPPALNERDKQSLSEVTPPVAAAVGNALAFSEIRRLRDRLAQEVVVLREAVDTQGMFEEIVGRSAPLREVLANVQMVAATDATVLVLGETGTGKELIARAIHKRSARAAGPLISVNCAALPATLISSELFGHERGAFTGAQQRRIGRFEMATDGTIFLDEIGDLPPDVQIALLRVLQERTFERVGGTHVIRTNARIIAATHRDLQAAVAAGTFRSDLFFRLNVFPIEMPPLRNRPDDIPLLVEYFAQRHGQRLDRRLQSVDAGSLRKLVTYSWPGNVRELENVIERAVILSTGNKLVIEDHALRGARGPGSVSTDGAALRAHLHDAERQLIEAALAASAGRVSGSSGAAKRLAIPASTLERKIRLHHIDKYRFRRN